MLRDLFGLFIAVAPFVRELSWWSWALRARNVPRDISLEARLYCGKLRMVLQYRASTNLKSDR